MSLYIKLSNSLLIICFLLFLSTVYGNVISFGEGGNSVSEIIRYVENNNTLSVWCTNSELKDTVELRLSFWREDVLRVEVNPSSDDYEEEHPNTNTGLEINSKDIRVKISGENSAIEIYRKNEKVLSAANYVKDLKTEKGVQVSFSLDSDEHFYGFGEKFNGLDQRGNRVVMELNDAFMSDDDSTYKSIPFFFSSKRYAMLVNSYQQIVFNMGNKSNTEYDFEIPGVSFEYYIYLNEDPLKVMEQYTELTGRPPVIPKWSLEPWLSRRGMTGWNNPSATEADIDMIIKDDFRLGVILWEGIRRIFHGKHADEMHKLSDKWQSIGIKQVSWDYTGHISPVTKNEVNHFPDEYFLKYADSSFCLGHRSGENFYIDASNNDAMEWWKKTLYEKRFLSDNGKSKPGAWNLDGVKLDFSELFPKNDSRLLNHDKTTGMHNHHPVAFSEQIYNWLQEVKPEGGITWVRGGGLGLQKVGFSWGGDRGRTFDQLKGTVMASLGVSVCGVSLIGHDLGGYRGGDSIDERKVYIRGVQYATFSPGFHDHGSAPAPWEQNKYGQGNYKFYTRVRYNILPYLYNYVKIGNETGVPIMRPLFLHYPDDADTYTVEDEYLLGDNLLVAPILTNSNTRKIYFPEGEWINFWNQQKHEGNKFENIYTPLNRIPVYAKSGSVIPLELNDALEIGGIFSHEKKNDLLLTFRFFEGDASELELFRDDYITVNKIKNDKHVEVTLRNIAEDFAIIMDAIKPDEISINGKVLIEQSTDDFSEASEGWYFNEKANQLLAKFKYVQDQKDYKIQFGDCKEMATGFSAEDKSELERPVIQTITGWNESVDMFFNEVEGAEYYVVRCKDISDNVIKTIEVPQPPVTVVGLVNGKEYQFTIQAVNDKNLSEEPEAEKCIPSKRNPFFLLDDKELFVNANHFLRRIMSENSERKFTYGFIAGKTDSYNVWVKMKTGYSHFRYFRWYKIGDIELAEGENYLTICLDDKDVIPGMLYFTTDRSERPFMKQEVEGQFIEKQINIKNEIVIRCF